MKKEEISWENSVKLVLVLKIFFYIENGKSTHTQDDVENRLCYIDSFKKVHVCRGVAVMQLHYCYWVSKTFFIDFSFSSQ